MACYRFFEKGVNNEAVAKLEVFDFPFHWSGDPRTFTKVKNHMAAYGLFLDNYQHCEQMPTIFLGSDLICRRVS